MYLGLYVITQVNICSCACLKPNQIWQVFTQVEQIFPILHKVFLQVRQGRIVGGQFASFGQWPWQISLMKYKVSFLSKLVSAHAHCVLQGGQVHQPWDLGAQVWRGVVVCSVGGHSSSLCSGNNLTKATCANKSFFEVGGGQDSVAS